MPSPIPSRKRADAALGLAMFFVLLAPACGSVGPLGDGGAAGSGAAGHAGTTGTGAGGKGGSAGNAGHAGSSGAAGSGACVCTDIYQPVCGADSKTYASSCVAACDGVAVAHPGACADAGADGSTMPGVCDTDADCVYQPGSCCNGTCAAKTDPAAAPPRVMCNIVCPAIALACSCVNHKCANAPVCSPTGGACLASCPNGYLKDANGCSTCQCAPGDAGADGPTCAPAGVACKSCPNGYLTGPGGCRTCDCKP